MERRMCKLDLQGVTSATIRSQNTTMDEDMDVQIHKDPPQGLSLCTAHCCRKLPTASPSSANDPLARALCSLCACFSNRSSFTCTSPENIANPHGRIPCNTEAQCHSRKTM